MSAFATLRNFARNPEALEHCDLCGTGLFLDHQHLLEPKSRRLICACDACALLFYQGGETKYKRVPRRVRALPDFRMTDARWDDLMIPIGLAFFVESSAENRVLAMYPSPAGSTESLLSLEAWAEIVQENPILAEMESDVEAILVNRLDGTGNYYMVPIDKCYQLVGLIRANWQGLSGGAEVWEKIRGFFQSLKERADA